MFGVDLRRWTRPGARQGAPRRARLYVRADCGLCREAHALTAPFERAGRVQLELVNIDGDEQLFRRYCLSIPVLEIEGGKTLEWPFTRSDLRRNLR